MSKSHIIRDRSSQSPPPSDLNYSLERSTSTETVVLIDDADEEPLFPSLDDDNHSLARSVILESKLNCCCHGIKSKTNSLLDVYTDQSGSCCNIIVGIIPFFLTGIILGIVLPNNPSLTTPIYDTISNIIGYTSFVCWSVSFYPQIITNYRNNSVVGVSTDGQVISWFNYFCYFISSTSLLWNQDMKEKFTTGQDSDIHISAWSKDLINSMQALLFATVLLYQVIIYRGFIINPISSVTVGLITSISLVCITYVVGVFIYPSVCYWLDFFQVLSIIMIALNVSSYLPQLCLNKKRLSTDGWNIWSVMLNTTASLLCLIHLVGDSISMNSTHLLHLHWLKVSFCFCNIFIGVLFFIQHFILYRNYIENDDLSIKSPIRPFGDFYEINYTEVV